MIQTGRLNTSSTLIHNLLTICVQPLAMRPFLLTAALLLAALPLLLFAQTPQNSGPTTLSSTSSQADTPAAPTVSVPIHDGDAATVTGALALHTRAGKQFLVIESPTPYRLLFPAASHATPRVIRDISFTLPGQAEAITPFAGRTITASGKLHLEPKTAQSWNGALLEATTVILPGGQQLRGKH